MRLARGPAILWHGVARWGSRVLESRWLPAIAAALAVVLALPAIGAGWILDDYYHRAVLQGRSRFRDVLGPPQDMFRFFRGDPSITLRAMDVGVYPWWTYPGLKAEFLQPLTVATHLADYSLWPDSPRSMHAHSLIWLGLLVAATAGFYSQVFSRRRLAGLAAILFAIDDVHGAVAGFIANRNSLLAATFGMTSLIFYVRWRRVGRRAGLAASLLLFLASLLCKEEGIATCAYLGSYALFLDAGGRLRGILALTPYAVLVVVWSLLRTYLGYGVKDMGWYVDPLNDPGQFLAAVVHRLPFLVAGQWGLFPADLAGLFQPPALNVLWWAAVAFLALLIVAFGPLLGRDPLARFWFAGMLFSTIPVSATFPMDRLLTFVGVGAFGLLAQFFEVVFIEPDPAPAKRAWRIVAVGLGGYFVFVHVAVASIALPFRAAFPVGPKSVTEGFFVHTPLPATVADETVVIVNAPSPLHACYLPILQDLSGLPIPRHTRVLACGLHDASIARRDEFTLAIRPDGGYLRWVLDRLFRTTRRPLSLGEEVALTGVTIKVTQLTDNDRPAEAEFRFDVPLEHHSLRWLCYRNGGFEPFIPPAVGASARLSGSGFFPE
jgi:hypothetical protein